MKACETCATPLPAQQRGRPRRFCTERCRKAQYRRPCPYCKRLMTGERGRNAPSCCGQCNSVNQWKNGLMRYGQAWYDREAYDPHNTARFPRVWTTSSPQQTFRRSTCLNGNVERTELGTSGKAEAFPSQAFEFQRTRNAPDCARNQLGGGAVPDDRDAATLRQQLAAANERIISFRDLTDRLKADMESAQSDVVAKNREIGRLRAELSKQREDRPEAKLVKEVLQF